MTLMNFTAPFFIIFISLVAGHQALALGGDTGLVHGRNAIIHAPDPAATAVKNKIFGQCMVVAGNGNMLGGPCSSLVLTLDAGKGNAILNARTTPSGSFEFNAPTAESYKLGVASRLYEVLSPTEAVFNGEKVDLQLRQK
jgi:hypothetical protein